jgi:hypothetical protein
VIKFYVEKVKERTYRKRPSVKLATVKERVIRLVLNTTVIYNCEGTSSADPLLSPPSQIRPTDHRHRPSVTQTLANRPPP